MSKNNLVLTANWYDFNELEHFIDEIKAADTITTNTKPDAAYRIIIEKEEGKQCVLTVARTISSDINSCNSSNYKLTVFKNCFDGISFIKNHRALVNEAGDLFLHMGFEDEIYESVRFDATNIEAEDLLDMAMSMWASLRQKSEILCTNAETIVKDVIRSAEDCGIKEYNDIIEDIK